MYYYNYLLICNNLEEKRKNRFLARQIGRGRSARSKVSYWTCLESTQVVSETTKVASPQTSLDSLPVNSGACLEPTCFVLEPKRHLTVEELQPDLNKLCAEEAKSEQSDSDIDSPSACGNCLKDGGQFPRCSGCKQCDIVLRTAKLKIGLRTNNCAELFRHYPA